MTGCRQGFFSWVLVVGFSQVFVDVTAQQFREMVSVFFCTTNKRENSGAGIIQDASAFAQGGGPLFERAFVFSNDLFCTTENATWDIVDVEIHWKCGQRNINVQSVQRVDKFRVAIGPIAAASVGSGVSALNLRHSIALTPLFNQQPTVNVFSVEPGLKELNNGDQINSFSINRKNGFQRADDLPDIDLWRFPEWFYILGGKQQVLHIAVIYIQLEFLNGFLLLSINMVSIFFRNKVS